MKIETLEGWNTGGNHDSRYTEQEVKALIGQARDLPGVKGQKDLGKMPEAIAAFVANCLFGDTTIWVIKGIHQRWDSVNAGGVLKKEADPHIQVKFSHTFTGAKSAAWIAVHVRLSEERCYFRTLRSGEEVVDCAWKTVGLSTVRFGMNQQWPAYFTQEVGNIQYQEPGKRGFKRRYSIGLVVPDEFKPKVLETV